MSHTAPGGSETGSHAPMTSPTRDLAPTPGPSFHRVDRHSFPSMLAIANTTVETYTDAMI
jgi:hypothetical protein